MSPEHRDLTIESVLADPMIRAANRADHVSLQDFEALLRATARDLRADRSSRSCAQDVHGAPKRDRSSWSACFA